MQIKTTGYLAAWRITFLSIIVNLLLSFGVEFTGISSVQITTLISTSAYTVFALCAALFFSRKDIGRGFTEMGFCRFNPWLIPLLIVIPVTSQLFCSFMISPITLLLQLLFGFETKEQILTPHGTQEILIAVLYLCILAPVSEEILFRGVIYRYFERHSTLTAIFMSSAVFAAAHLDIRSVIPIFFIGLSLALIRFATGSLWATMISHSAVNMFSLSMMLMGNNDILYTVIVLVLAVSFPFAMHWFITHTKFPPLVRSTQKCGVSMFMILTIVVFVAFQVLLLVNNIMYLVENGKELFYQFGEEFSEEFEREFGEEYDFYDGFDSEFGYGYEFR